MNFRRLLLFALLIVAAWLALFGDKTPPADAVSPPKPPRMTEMNERFMPLHMM